MTSLALAAAVVTLVCLDIIIAIGAGIPESSAGEQVIAVAVPVMDIALVLSSALMLRMCGDSLSSNGCSFCAQPDIVRGRGTASAD